MTDVAYVRLLDALRDGGRRVVETNGGSSAMAQCPAHNDGHPSLRLTHIDGSVLLHCFAGCDTSEVVKPLDLTTCSAGCSNNANSFDWTPRRQEHRRKRANSRGLTRKDAADHIAAGKTLDELIDLDRSSRFSPLLLTRSALESLPNPRTLDRQRS